MSRPADHAPQFDPTGMEQAAKMARAELAAYYNGSTPNRAEIILHLARWWEKWFITAGHKRLGRVLLDLARHPEEVSGE